MRSQRLGKSTSKTEVLNISQNGVWLFVSNREYFMSFKQYPWFKEATIAEIQNVKLLHGHHLHWEDLDIDLELESIKSPENYPLVYKK